MNVSLARIAKPWKAIEKVLNVRSKHDYAAAIERLHALLDDGADAPNHPLHGLLHALGVAVRDYEERHIAIPDATPRETLAFLMQQHGLKQGGLPEVGPQSTISDLLSGRRAFHARHIAALSRRFGVPADTFMDETQYLLSSPVNARRLTESISQARSDKNVMRKPIEPRKAAQVQEPHTPYRSKPTRKNPLRKQFY